MALIECPDCKRQISDAAAACPHCGRPIADERRSFYTSAPARSAQLTPTLASPVLKRPRDDLPASWKCPRCGTVGAFRSFPELHAGAAPANDSIGNLRERVAPPLAVSSRGARMRVIGALAGLVAAAAIYAAIRHIWTAVGGGIIVAAGWITVTGGSRTRGRSLADLTSEWERRYLCTACGFERELSG